MVLPAAALLPATATAVASTATAASFHATSFAAATFADATFSAATLATTTFVSATFDTPTVIIDTTTFAAPTHAGGILWFIACTSVVRGDHGIFVCTWKLGENFVCLLASESWQYLTYFTP